jgi:hypothetical protein
VKSVAHVFCSDNNQVRCTCTCLKADYNPPLLKCRIVIRHKLFRSWFCRWTQYALMISGRYTEMPLGITRTVALSRGSVPMAVSVTVYQVLLISPSRT